MPRNLDMGLFFWKNLALVQNIYWKALAYEACHHMCTPLHMPTTLERCKKSMHCLIQKASRCAADCMSKTTMLFIFHFLYNTKILGENHVIYFSFHYFSGENCIIFLFSLHKERIKKEHEWWNNHFSDVFTYHLNPKNFASLFFLIQDNFML